MDEQAIGVQALDAAALEGISGGSLIGYVIGHTVGVLVGLVVHADPFDGNYYGVGA